MSEFSQKVLNLQSRNLVYTRTMSCCIVELRIRLIAFILPFLYPFFYLFGLNLCQFFSGTE